MDPERYIVVTNDDIRVAKSAWSTAEANKAPAARVEQLRRGYEQLLRTQAQQLAEGFGAQK